MQCLERFYADLSQLKTDDEVAQALREFFSGLGEVSSACRFAIFEADDARNFLIKFQSPADMIKITSLYKLRSFGFDGVLVEVGRGQGA